MKAAEVSTLKVGRVTLAKSPEGGDSDPWGFLVSPKNKRKNTLR